MNKTVGWDESEMISIAAHPHDKQNTNNNVHNIVLKDKYTTYIDDEHD